MKLLLQYSRKLSSFQKRAKLVHGCLEEVLASGSSLTLQSELSPTCRTDDDLAAMYLTAKQLGAPRDSHDHEELELLMESFDKQVEEIVSEIENLSANVSATEAIVELILDSNRNELLALDLKVSIGTLGLTSGALVAGLFGMVSRSSSPLARPFTDRFNLQNVRRRFPFAHFSTNRIMVPSSQRK